MRRGELHAPSRVHAGKIAGESDGDQGHILGILGPEPEEERIADDLHAHLLHYLHRKLFRRPFGGCDQLHSGSHALFHLRASRWREL